MGSKEESPVVAERISADVRDRTISSELRMAAMHDLYIEAYRGAIPVLLAVARDREEEIEVRRKALLTLATIPAPPVVEALFDFLLDATLTRDARKYLQMMTDVAIGTSAPPTPAARIALRDEWLKWWAKHKAHVVLRPQGGSEPISAVAPEDWRPPKPIRLIGSLTESEMQTVLALSECIVDKNVELASRVEAATNLGGIRSRVILPALLAVARDPSDAGQLRNTAIGAMSQLPDPLVVESLFDLLLDVQVSESARYNLSMLTGVQIWNESMPRSYAERRALRDEW